MKPKYFRDRVHAGQLLAAELVQFAGRSDVMILGLPRGGVPVAFEIAHKLHAPLDVLVVRKIGVPGWEELAMGALATGGIRFINEAVVRNVGVSPHALEAAVARELRELQRREIAYRGHTGLPNISGKIVILVDDGIATGSTLQAAVKAIRQQGPERVIIAAPTASAEACGQLAPMVDGLVVLIRPPEFDSVGQWYGDFSQTSDGEVTALLKHAQLFKEPA